MSSQLAPIPALISGVGSTTALSVIKALKIQSEFDITIVGADTHQDTEIAGSSFCNKFHTVPLAAEEERYIERILGIVKTEDMKIFMPIVNNGC